MQRVHVDLMGPFVKSGHYTYLLSAICPFTKYLVCVPIADKTALNVAKALVKHLFLVYGQCDLLFTDQGKEFCNEVLNNVCRLMGIQKSSTSGYRPSSDGAVEKVQGTISTIIAKMVHRNQKNWAEIVPYVTFAYNTSIHSVTRYSPFFLMFLRDPITAIDFQLEQPSPATPTDLDEFTELLLKRMREAHEIVGDQLQAAFARNKRRYDARVRHIQIKEGDYVWFFLPRIKPGLMKKWQHRTDGPFKIIKKLNEVNFVLQKFPTAKPFIAHIDRMRLFKGQLPAVWQRVENTEVWPPEKLTSSVDQGRKMAGIRQVSRNASSCSTHLVPGIQQRASQGAGPRSTAPGAVQACLRGESGDVSRDGLRETYDGPARGEFDPFQ